VHLVRFTIEIYYDARSYKRQMCQIYLKIFILFIINIKATEINHTFTKRKKERNCILPEICLIPIS